MPVLQTETTLPCPIGQVFEFFGAAGNLERITPPRLRFRILGEVPSPITAGTRIRYRLRLGGVPFGWTTNLTVWNPPHSFVDEQEHGPYRCWIHLHEFSTEGAGTRMRDQVTYQLPFGCAGQMVHWWIRRELRGIFAYRAAAVQRILCPDAAQADLPAIHFLPGYPPDPHWFHSGSGEVAEATMTAPGPRAKLH